MGDGAKRTRGVEVMGSFRVGRGVGASPFRSPASSAIVYICAAMTTDVSSNYFYRFIWKFTDSPPLRLLISPENN